MPKLTTPSIFALVCFIFLLSSGCGLRVDYSKFDPRCREWLGIDNNNNIQWDFIKTTPDIQSYYEFYMCINIPYQHVTGNTDYFSTHAMAFLAFVPAKLAAPRDDKEILLISIIFNEMAKTHRDDIRNNPQLVSAWKSAIDNMKRQDGFPYTVSYGLFNAVILKP